MFIETMSKFGVGNLQMNKMVTYVVKLSTDVNQSIKDASFECLVEMYKHMGDRLRVDLKKRQLPETK